MVEKRRGLGRGLGALISSAPAAEEDAAPEEPLAQSKDDGPNTNSADSTYSPDLPSREAVSRETPPAELKVNRTGRARTASGDQEPTAGKKTSRTRNQGNKKPRPVDMFFSPGGAEGSGLSEGPASAGRASGTMRGSRAAMPDVLGQVRQRRDGESLDQTEKAPNIEGLDASVRSDDHKEPADHDGGRVASGEGSVPRETLVRVPGAEFAEIEVGSIHPNRKQPRTVFDEEDMAELVHSIKEVGLLQPIVVRPSDEEGAQLYELVMGERRWRAVQMAGLATIPAIVRQTSDTDLLRDALLENLHRSQLNPLEEAAAYQQLMQEFECTQEELSDRIGRSRPQISNTIRLMKLPALVQRRVAAGVLSAGHARALLGLSDAGEMERLAQRIVNEGLSVRATEEIVSLNDGLRRPAREKSNRTAARHERLDYLANSLSDHLETTVKITLGAKKGRVSIEFGSVDDLNRIMGVIAPPSE
ncbi:ParB/RepB/Spo0J family partition protein [Arthrobacter sp. JSM 101049]|uniref:ParB/RepB/Spo0J family partition protein n=1 Tax=Arthrobacter sp. JSM 101049 TaxID=929097 RepID=UPI00356AF4FE